MTDHTSPAHPALAPGQVAVITGAASGIGRAAALRFAGMGLKVVLADLPGPALQEAAEAVSGRARGGVADIRAVPTDVSRFETLERLRQEAYDAFGAVHVLMNNAGIQPNPGSTFKNLDGWRTLLDVNLWGVIHGVHAFVPAMLAQGTPGLIVNTGSKQGITTPPGNAAYNVSKAGVKAYTEALAHELRNTPGSRLAAHLLIPGFTHTGLTGTSEKPDAAWTADQVVGFMLERLSEGDFYILCPDNDVSRATDERRMQWAVDDIIRNRPALSRWHPDFKDAFERFMAG
ncbi:SDR family NAD(P)-dependent oxidoreductase [Microvirga pudoricolor]|uniref:SDR family NAD(P)-dependent oxidoreductase n=1 Tax=Microvirga pudoricolor TaxID=2778729 RepID=UPI0019513B7A|nr:SDR family NAD(P)-dependent oxidoreductase [Microvirga pudoricolor]MBM6593269.1 SDR family NAD(P)-dependent oxidoreductase [Microvirga pudoricolor]